MENKLTKLTETINYYDKKMYDAEFSASYGLVGCIGCALSGGMLGPALSCFADGFANASSMQLLNELNISTMQATMGAFFVPATLCLLFAGVNFGKKKYYQKKSLIAQKERDKYL